MPRPEWRQRAACTGIGPAIFYPTESADVAPAKAVCATCPVTAECIAEGIALGEDDGIRGGLTYDERRRLR